MDTISGGNNNWYFLHAHVPSSGLGFFTWLVTHLIQQQREKLVISISFTDDAYYCSKPSQKIEK